MGIKPGVPTTRIDDVSCHVLRSDFWGNSDLRDDVLYLGWVSGGREQGRGRTCMCDEGFLDERRDDCALPYAVCLCGQSAFKAGRLRSPSPTRRMRTSRLILVLGSTLLG